MRKIADLMGSSPSRWTAPKPPPSRSRLHSRRHVHRLHQCIQACPVDAILGATKAMHTVIAAECTGCDLCVDPCPTDCIEMIPVPTTVDNWKWDLANVAIPVKIVE
jgi:electron transport complex protein RnfB